MIPPDPVRALGQKRIAMSAGRDDLIFSSTSSHLSEEINHFAAPAKCVWRQGKKELGLPRLSGICLFENNFPAFALSFALGGQAIAWEPLSREGADEHLSTALNSVILEQQSEYRRVALLR